MVDAEEVEEGIQLGLIEMQRHDSLTSQNQLLITPNLYQRLDHDKFPFPRFHANEMMSLFGSLAKSVKSFVSQPPNFC